MFDLALELTNTSPAETAMLGDRLDTDIDGAADMGLGTIMVLTGVSTRAEAEKNRFIPDVIVTDLPALQQIWQRSVDESGVAASSTDPTALDSSETY